MTEKLFYEDSHLSEFEAAVTACRRREPASAVGCGAAAAPGSGKETDAPEAEKRVYYEIELDRTAFFPEGGGQYADTGTLACTGSAACTGDSTCEDSTVRVSDVQEEGQRIIHIADGPLEVGSRVRGRIDWDERSMKMQQHTGEHIVSGLVHARFGYNNVGFHLGSEDCTMDFNGEITPEELAQIELEANRAVWKNLEVRTLYPSKEELARMEYRSKIEIEGQVRVIVIPGYDRCACCAPHVARTGEIGLIKLTNVQRYKGGVRVTMLCGVRALADYALRQEQTKAVSAMLCAKEKEIAEAVAHLREECASLKYEIIEKEKKLTGFRADMIPAGAEAVCVFSRDIEGESMRLFMNRVLEAGHCLCAVFHPMPGAPAASSKESPDRAREKRTYRYVIGSKSRDMRAFAKEFNTAFEGRGGGRPEMIQGTASGREEEIRAWIIEKAEDGR